MTKNFAGTCKSSLDAFEGIKELSAKMLAMNNLDCR